jgi:microcin C transport system substrate-binding protein
VGLEAFKADQLDWFAERSGKQWSTAYDFPAVREKRVIKEKFPDTSSGRMQGFAFNLRRPLFADVRLRRAFNYAYDWEESDRQLSNGEYHRDSSYFDGIPELMSSGVPEGLELQILETVRDKVPAEVFTKPYQNPVGGNPEASRNNLREATRLLKEVGFEVRDRKLLDSAGRPVSVEFLCQDPGDERSVLFYKPYLERLGITVNVRTVDSVQYQNRLRSFDFDIITAVWGQSLSPGNEQRDFFGSEAADQPGSRNRPGIKNPAVDALINRIIFAKDRAELVASCKALDRVLLWNAYVVPQFAAGFNRYARWDRFSHPEPLPKYGVSGFPSLWWWDAEKAARTGGRS